MMMPGLTKPGVGVAMIALLIVIAPLLQKQIVGLFAKAPAIIDAVTVWLEPAKAALQEIFPGQPLDEIGATSKTFGAAAAAWLDTRLIGCGQSSRHT